MITFFHALILLKGLRVLDYVAHILDLVRHDKLHPWKTSVAYEILGGGDSNVSDIDSDIILGVYSL